MRSEQTCHAELVAKVFEAISWPNCTRGTQDHPRVQGKQACHTVCMYLHIYYTYIICVCARVCKHILSYAINEITIQYSGKVEPNMAEASEHRIGSGWFSILWLSAGSTPQKLHYYLHRSHQGHANMEFII